MKSRAFPKNYKNKQPINTIRTMKGNDSRKLKSLAGLLTDNFFSGKWSDRCWQINNKPVRNLSSSSLLLQESSGGHELRHPMGDATRNRSRRGLMEDCGEQSQWKLRNQRKHTTAVTQGGCWHSNGRRESRVNQSIEQQWKQMWSVQWCAWVIHMQISLPAIYINKKTPQQQRGKLRLL